jgi:hypothetical protein
MNLIRSESLTRLIPALIAARGAMPAVVKDAKNPHFGNRYAELATVLEACEPTLAKHGLAVVQATRWAEGMLTLETTLFHASGEFLGGSYPLCADVAQPQKMGAAVTYARRYCYLAIVGVAPEDDDGETASGRGAVGERRAPAAPQPAPQPAAAPAPAAPQPAHNGANPTTKPKSSQQQPATEQQLRCLCARAKSRGIDLDAVLAQEGIATLDELTRRKASDLIDQLSARAAEEKDHYDPQLGRNVVSSRFD